ncbi:unannotated protein [freshwater metagenome]|uniref:Unannotated protein n=1 Tax=freshwater metagenome TaxID=449393 RepID=A0A6J6Z4G0_9ZZZZ
MILVRVGDRRIEDEEAIGEVQTRKQMGETIVIECNLGLIDTAGNNPDSLALNSDPVDDIIGDKFRKAHNRSRSTHRSRSNKTDIGAFNESKPIWIRQWLKVMHRNDTGRESERGHRSAPVVNDGASITSRPNGQPCRLGKHSENPRRSGDGSNAGGESRNKVRVRRTELTVYIENHFHIVRMQFSEFTQ